MDADANDDINVRSDSYWIAHTMGECGRCGAATRLIALALPPGHESLTLEWSVDEDESVRHVWESTAARAFLFYIEYLPEGLQRRLGEFSRNYRLAESDYTHAPYWANHCGSCGSPMDDHDLFCEPGGAFLPATPETAAEVTLVRIAQALEASAIGYACEPQFFESMVAG
jgi:hypothetical protein